jgi:glycosyltransferase involved in cell wall biosynthesis
MQEKIENRKLVIVNQAANYLTVGLCNAFSQKMGAVDLITGGVHEQGESLSKNVNITTINKFTRVSRKKKYIGYLTATIRIYVLLMTKFRKHEVFFISTPPMAYLLKVLLPHKTSMLIWDVYPDLFKITGMKESHPFFRVWAFLNRIVFKRAFKLYTIGDRMAGLLEKYVDRSKINVTPIWSIFQSNGKVVKEKNPFVSEQNIQDKFVVQYSGNIGLTHNVEVLVEIAERMKKYDKIMFQIIGKGDRLSLLKQMAKEKKLNNCQFLPFQSDEMFQFSLSAADLGVVILDDVTSKGSVPSKSYNLMSFGIPSLYIAADDSELHDYSVKYNHAECFQKDDLEFVINFISRLSDDDELYKKYSQNALDAADDYKRSNADKIVELYLTE